MKRRESLGSTAVQVGASTPSKVSKRKISATASTAPQITQTLATFEQSKHYFFQVFQNPVLRARILGLCYDTLDVFSVR